VKKIVEKQMECRLAGETSFLGGNLPQRHFCPSQNPTFPHPGLNPGRRGGKPATNRLSYGAAMSKISYLNRDELWPVVILHEPFRFVSSFVKPRDLASAKRSIFKLIFRADLGFSFAA
jgi:hypothetical protein